jgi:hypothetical protein
MYGIAAGMDTHPAETNAKPGLHVGMHMVRQGSGALYSD